MENEPISSASQPSMAELKAQYDSLHSLVISLMLLLIVISGTFWIFMMRQARTIKGDLEVAKVAHNNAVAQFRSSQGIIDETVKQLQEFGRTHPDFVPILTKYRLTNTPPSTVPAPKKK